MSDAKSNLVTTAKGHVQIRTTRAADGAALLEMRLEMLKHNPTAFGASYEDTLKQSADEWSQRAQRNDGSGSEAVFVAVAGDRLVGSMGVYLGPNSKTRHSAGFWGVYIRPEWRGLRLVDAMMGACTQWATSKGAVILRLDVSCENHVAIRSYRRCGFKITGTQAGMILWEGKYYDEAQMAEWLIDPGAARASSLQSGTQ